VALANDAILVSQRGDSLRLTLTLAADRCDAGRLRVALPEGVPVLVAGRGEQRIEGLGDLRLETETLGDLRLEDHRGPVAVNLRGDATARLEGLEGPVSVTDVDGAGDGAKSLRIEDARGDVTVRLASTRAAVRLRDVVRADVEVSFGTVEVDGFRDLRVKSGRGPVTVENGTGNVEVETERGDQTIQCDAREVVSLAHRGNVTVAVGSDCRSLQVIAKRGDVEYGHAARRGSRHGYFEFHAPDILGAPGGGKRVRNFHAFGSVTVRDQAHVVIRAPKGRIRFRR
jgi:hypothetical protein